MEIYILIICIGSFIPFVIFSYVYFVKKTQPEINHAKKGLFTSLKVSYHNIVPFLKEIYVSLYGNPDGRLSDKYFYASHPYIECKFDPELFRILFFTFLQNQKKIFDPQTIPTLYIQNRERKIAIRINNSEVTLKNLKALSTCKKILQLHQGILWVEKGYQNRSIITIFIPKYKKTDKEETNLELTSVNHSFFSNLKIRNKVISQQPDPSLNKTIYNFIIQIIEENIDNPQFDVNNLVRASGLSRTSLYTKLKTETGLTPKEFILKIKLEKASHLLVINPELQIQDISSQLGFNSTRSFTRWFKHHFHCTPMKYRKEKR